MRHVSWRWRIAGEGVTSYACQIFAASVAFISYSCAKIDDSVLAVCDQRVSPSLIVANTKRRALLLSLLWAGNTKKVGFSKSQTSYKDISQKRGNNLLYFERIWQDTHLQRRKTVVK